MTDETEKDRETLHNFPCDFTIKIFGATDNNKFEETVLGVIHHNVPSFNDTAIQTNVSKNGKYKALSITIYIENKAQIDKIYQELTSSPHVLMVL